MRKQGRGMKRLLTIRWLLFLTGCTSLTSTTTTTTPIPQIAGAWEITAKSDEQQGYSTLIEGNLQQGSAASGSAAITAAGDNQLVLIGEHPSGGLFFGGLCPGTAVENLTGTLSTFGTLTLTLTEGGSIYTLAGTVNASGQSMSGTYTFLSGSCPDNGAFTGVQVSALAGTYAGTLNFTNGNSDSATATLSESGPASFTVGLTLTGADNTTITLTGLVVGNSFSVQGALAGDVVSYYGYYSIGEKSIYLVDASSDTPIGTLIAQ